MFIMNKTLRNKNRGFTLVEIAIVLMIIGLLIGGILRGQELITSARVRNIIDQKSAIQTAYIGFIDRYRALPGDLTADQAIIVGNNVAGGGFGGDGIVLINNDSPLFFQNVTAAGFISCGVCTQTITGAATINNSPANVFGGVVAFGWTAGGPAVGPFRFLNEVNNVPARMGLSSGAAIPSQTLAEVDRKADDNFPGLGSLRYSESDTPMGLAICTTAAVAPATQITWANPSAANCEGTWLF
jgi:prepilin-type N-terminal cleavage/methylation domain-containing protein